MNSDGSRLTLDLNALPREFVESPSVNPKGGDHRGNLHDRTGEVLGDDPTSLRQIDRTHLVTRRDDAGGVEGVGLDAEHDLARVTLLLPANEGQQSGRRSDRNHQYAGRVRVERPGVADASLA